MSDAFLEDPAHLYARYASITFAYLRQHTASPEDAEDILYDIFLNVLERGGLPELDEHRQRAWFLRVAHNKVVDRYRRAQRRQLIALDLMTERLFADEGLAPEQQALQREEYLQLQTAIRLLPEVQQEVLTLHFSHGLRCTEIAALLGKRAGTIRSQLARALNTLRAYYQEEAHV
ncbi:RNA polymerase sigma factor [Tengunoibacter tsumagoiensis]|uniref:RNA polymerase sigma24 factor n=1 Tax=Tengunoibacter tsumagoiensis TaxID=2014871 RepID=A0A401ZX29_9CHLR|nr:RNA polymerase sigma factor [Tengunoibacter tsumagoiensis]GCE11386.1 RNA polymerase sigma24 factor [Tengunoibacter tsumagoiensis]